VAFRELRFVHIDGVACHDRPPGSSGQRALPVH